MNNKDKDKIVDKSREFDNSLLNVVLKWENSITIQKDVWEIKEEETKWVFVKKEK